MSQINKKYEILFPSLLFESQQPMFHNEKVNNEVVSAKYQLLQDLELQKESRLDKSITKFLKKQRYDNPQKLFVGDPEKDRKFLTSYEWLVGNSMRNTSKEKQMKQK